MNKFLAVLCLLFVLSCRSDKKEGLNNNDNTVVGVWKINKKQNISGVDKLTVLYENIPDECKKNGTYEFTNDNKYIINDYNLINNNCINSYSQKTYQFNSSQNKLRLGNNPNLADVLKLNSNELVILVFDDHDSNEDGVKDYLKYYFYK